MRALRLILGVAAVAVVAAILALLIGDDEVSPAGRGGAQFIRSVPGDSAVIWAVGDGDASAEAAAVVDLIEADAPHRVLYLGDVYELGTADEFRRNFQPTYGRLARITAPTPGNHDWGASRTGYDPYWRRVHGRRVAHWYAFGAAGWQIISLNSETAHGEGSAQHRWLRRQVRLRGTCRIAFWHKARFSAGTNHGDSEDLASLWNALRGRAVMVLSGHEHNMQRLRPVDGITQFVSGAGGRGLYGLNSGDRRLAFGNDTDFGAVRLWLQPGRAEYAFFAADGRVLDEGTIACRRIRA